MDTIALFDSHCHIDFHQFDDDRETAFSRMRAAGVEGAVAVCVELEQAARLMALAEARHDVWFSVGVHPNHVVENEPDEQMICRLATHPKCVAIGETGMDLFRKHVDQTTQEARFRTHIRAAKALNKPVIVHMRDADEPTLRVLREEGIGEAGGIMHCFSSTWEVASEALDMGMHIAFSGNVTFGRNEELREVARQVPDERLLIETDAPYLAPNPYRGKRNEPAYVRCVAECLAEVRSVELAELAAATTANARRCFRIA